MSLTHLQCCKTTDNGYDKIVDAVLQLAMYMAMLVESIHCL